MLDNSVINLVELVHLQGLDICEQIGFNDFSPMKMNIDLMGKVKKPVTFMLFHVPNKA